MIFVRDYQEKIFKDAEADVPLADLCELLSEEWKNMSEAEREVKSFKRTLRGHRVTLQILILKL